MKQYCILILSIFITGNLAFSQDTLHQYKINYYNQKVIKYLDREKQLSNFYKIDKEGVKVYASPIDKLKDSVEFKIKWQQFAEFNKCLRSGKDATYFASKKHSQLSCDQKSESTQQPAYSHLKKLSGLKIAIDPGHVAGDFEMGKTEMKFLSFKKDSVNGLPDSIQIAEGMLTFATATLLKEKLEADGATVFLTRKQNGYTAFGKTFDQWLKDDYKNKVEELFKAGKLSTEKKNQMLSSQYDKRKKFLLFKDIELAKRADLINEFDPDFTVIIHFNVDETNLGWKKPGNKNYNMTFIGGAFMPGDLSSREKRFEFLRMIVSNDIEESIQLSGAVTSQFESVLKVKTAGPNDAKYLREGCLSTPQKGVYCRNLQLTRYIHGPLVYGETLYQDNINECKALNKESDKTKNERIKEVAEAYYKGIWDYITTKNVN
ncbi:MAG: N-acetylmuramoyl-L-alanine amidase [Bacteroidetes bacterium]|nr:N-acetylmuramoyl-L-alanine amidase [Bacteroidota bacterium]